MGLFDGQFNRARQSEIAGDAARWERGTDARTKQKNIERALAFEKLKEVAIQAEKDAFRITPENQDRYLALEELPGYEGVDQEGYDPFTELMKDTRRKTLAQGVGAFGDPARLQQALLSGMRSQGFDDTKTAPLLSSFMSRNFPTANPEMVKLQIENAGDRLNLTDFVSKGGTTTNNSTSSNKNSSGDSNFRANMDQIDKKLESIARPGAPGFFGRTFDIGRKDNFVDDWKTGIAKISTQTGADPLYVYSALESFNSDTTLPPNFNIRNPPKEVVDSIGAIALNTQTKQRASSGGSSRQSFVESVGLDNLQQYINTHNQNRDSRVQAALASLTPRALTAEQRFEALAGNNPDRLARFGFRNPTTQEGKKGGGGQGGGTGGNNTDTENPLGRTDEEQAAVETEEKSFLDKLMAFKAAEEQTPETEAQTAAFAALGQQPGEPGGPQQSNSFFSEPTITRRDTPLPPVASTGVESPLAADRALIQLDTDASIQAQEDEEFETDYGDMIRRLNDPSSTMYQRGVPANVKARLVAQGEQLMAQDPAFAHLVRFGGKYKGTRNERIMQAMIDLQQQQQIP